MSNEPVVLLHGFYHGAWAWTEVIAELGGRGRTAVAVDMAAHGLHATSPASAARRPFDPVAYATEPSPVSGVGLDAAADLLVAQLDSVGGGKPVCVVAHSMGGAVLSRAAERRPELVAHMVYLAAYMPASNTPCLDYPSLPEGRDNRFMQLLVGDPATIGALRIDHRSPDPEAQAAIRAAFYGDVEPSQAAAATALLSCDAPLAMVAESTTLTEQGWGSIPRTYVVCTEDRTIPAGLQRLFVAQADTAFPTNPTTVVELPTAHSAFLSAPARVADIIADRAAATRQR
ncbi:alpha/beta fold hydrolase [Amycolatopsis sp. DSM 110486]|uniref:alpha/beta fold hydrolase n=1 Tax=Amycolatopsis sp. DSM 110486 TaxID=2865832 RepID=UPI001C695960|nr:alpha/beta fold hydrolase [Amycolatopsis sp. DSM 110486]QYN21506.1 alpha/beta hydrolase [Amycolatopsis sp. DSM 110486]